MVADCPKCHEHSLGYNPYKKRAGCCYVPCSFKEKMSHKKYLEDYADLSYYLLPKEEIERIERLRALRSIKIK